MYLVMHVLDLCTLQCIRYILLNIIFSVFISCEIYLVFRSVKILQGFILYLCQQNCVLFLIQWLCSLVVCQMIICLVIAANIYILYFGLDYLHLLGCLEVQMLHLQISKVLDKDKNKTDVFTCLICNAMQFVYRFDLHE